MIELSTDKKLLLINGHRKLFLEMASIHGEDAVKIVEMTTKGLVYDIKLVDKQWQSFKRINSYFESSIMSKRCQATSDAAEKLFMKGRVSEANFICVLF